MCHKAHATLVAHTDRPLDSKGSRDWTSGSLGRIQFLPCSLSLSPPTINFHRDGWMHRYFDWMNSVPSVTCARDVSFY